ncbi:hypothetical protein PF002_g17879 [Phytophthora fragariae]|uniref:Uncharacterized protein n=1 Tax=Phytophthora fragariae TaxID=53985 RepID=A0A6A3Y867_9STRA|nr:hypothetical protein PF002_g17879 [Phytophthora fragariae]
MPVKYMPVVTEALLLIRYITCCNNVQGLTRESYVKWECRRSSSWNVEAGATPSLDGCPNWGHLRELALWQ